MNDSVPPSELPGAEAARLRLRSAGYCVLCDRLVEVTDDGGCKKGHPSEAISGSFALAADEQVPELPAYNLAALALPPVWGPAHGLWAGVFFLPIWLFADSVVSTFDRGPVAAFAAVLVPVLTIAFQIFFAKRANGVAWRRAAGAMTVQEFIRRERIWAMACIPIGLALLSWAIYYRLVLA